MHRYRKSRFGSSPMHARRTCARSGSSVQTAEPLRKRRPICNDACEVREPTSHYVQLHVYSVHPRRLHCATPDPPNVPTVRGRCLRTRRRRRRSTAAASACGRHRRFRPRPGRPSADLPSVVATAAGPLYVRSLQPPPQPPPRCVRPAASFEQRAAWPREHHAGATRTNLRPSRRLGCGARSRA
jgi:hypothetical protein